ncbi:hypothetical protein ACFV9E_36080 [Streptomyces sp. NPDC059835]|uniref:hypothetical protein n=1 Tax=Streptomyces sp. NPDC059835 TaxID=3346967 RepID=UPI00366916F4
MPKNKPAAIEADINGTIRNVHHDEIKAAAATLTRASSDATMEFSWYALVGQELHYVAALVGEAVGEEVDVKTARLLLHDLGFPVMAYTWKRKTVAAPHSDHS